MCDLVAAELMLICEVLDFIHTFACVVPNHPIVKLPRWYS